MEKLTLALNGKKCVACAVVHVTGCGRQVVGGRLWGKMLGGRLWGKMVGRNFCHQGSKAF